MSVRKRVEYTETRENHGGWKGGACDRYGIEKKCTQNFNGDTWMKDTALKTYVRWENNIKVDLTDSG
jgi:hypothetical protein